MEKSREELVADLFVDMFDGEPIDSGEFPKGVTTEEFGRRLAAFAEKENLSDLDMAAILDRCHVWMVMDGVDPESEKPWTATTRVFADRDEAERFAEGRDSGTPGTPAIGGKSEISEVSLRGWRFMGLVPRAYRGVEDRLKDANTLLEAIQSGIMEHIVSLPERAEDAVFGDAHLREYVVGFDVSSGRQEALVTCGLTDAGQSPLLPRETREAMACAGERRVVELWNEFAEEWPSARTGRTFREVVEALDTVMEDSEAQEKWDDFVVDREDEDCGFIVSARVCDGNIYKFEISFVDFGTCEESLVKFSLDESRLATMTEVWDDGRRETFVNRLLRAIVKVEEKREGCDISAPGPN